MAATERQWHSPQIKQHPLWSNPSIEFIGVKSPASSQVPRVMEAEVIRPQAPVASPKQRSRSPSNMVSRIPLNSTLLP
jgi:hypothetical protein